MINPWNICNIKINVLFSICFFISVYSSAIQEISSSLLYSGLIEELVDVLQLEDVKLVVSNGDSP